jgi:hypothetical protein
MDLKKLGRFDTDWFNMAEDSSKWWALVKRVINLRVS